MTVYPIGTKLEHPKFGAGIIIDDSDEYTYQFILENMAKKNFPKILTDT